MQAYYDYSEAVAISYANVATPAEGPVINEMCSRGPAARKQWVPAQSVSERLTSAWMSELSGRNWTPGYLQDNGSCLENSAAGIIGKLGGRVSFRARFVCVRRPFVQHLRLLRKTNQLLVFHLCGPDGRGSEAAAVWRTRRHQMVIWLGWERGPG